MSSVGNMVRRRGSVLRRGSIVPANIYNGRKMSMSVQEDFELSHLSPSIQRFWKVTQIVVHSFSGHRTVTTSLHPLLLAFLIFI